MAFHAQAIGTDVVKYYEDDGGETVAFETVTLNEGQLYIEASLVDWTYAKFSVNSKLFLICFLA